MNVVLIVVAAVFIAGLLAVVLLVSVASRREESLHSVAGRAPGRLEGAARRLLAFHSAGLRTPRSLAQARAKRAARAAENRAFKPMTPVP